MISKQHKEQTLITNKSKTHFSMTIERQKEIIFSIKKINKEKKNLQILKTVQLAQSIWEISSETIVGKIQSLKLYQ